MANAGNSMEEYIAMMTAITEITRSADKAANGLKTLTLRLQGMDDEGEESLEVQAKMEALFNKLGISVYKANGELKNTYEIMGSLAPVYQTLTNAEKAYVTETIAGKYQAQNAAALLNNWSQAVKANETAINSQGSALTENGKVLDSIEGKIKAFKSAFQELSRTMIDSDLIKWFVDLGTAVLNFANSDIGQVIIKASLLTGVFKISQSSILKYITSIKQAAAALLVEKAATEAETLSLIKNKAASLTLSDVIKTLAAKKILLANGSKSVTAAEIAETASTLTLGKAFKALTVSMLQNPLFWGAAAIVGVSLLVGWLDDLSNAAQKAYEEAKEEADKAMDEYEKAKSEVERLNSELDATKNKVDELQAKGKLSFTEEEELKRLKEQTAELEKQVAYADILEQRTQKKANAAKVKEIQADLFAGDITRFRNNNNGVANTVAGWSIPIVSDIAANMTTEAYKIDEMDVIKETQEKYKNYVEKIAEYQKQVNDLKQEIVEANEKGKNTDELESQLSSAEHSLNLYKGWNEDNKEKLTDYAKRLKAYSDAITYVENATDDADIKSNQYKEALAKHYRQIINLIEPEQALGVELGYVASQYSEAYEKIIELNEGNKLNEESLKALLADFPELEAYLNSLTNDYGWTLLDIINGINSSAESSNEKVADAESILANYSKTLDTIKAKYDMLTSAVDEYNNSGFLSAETLQKMMDNNLLEYLTYENGKLVANTEALYNSAEAARIATSQKLSNAMADDMLAIAEERTKDASKLAQAAVKNLGDNAETAGNQASTATGKFVGFAEAVDQANKALEGKELTDDIQSRIDAVKNAYKPYFDLLSKPIQINKLKYTTEDKSSSKSSKSEKEWWEKELQSLKDQFNYNEITIEEYINGLDKLLGKTQKGSEAWKKINEELQKQRLSKVEDDYKAGRISLEQYIAKLKELLKAYKEGTKAWNELAEKIKKGLQDQAKETKSDYDDAKSAIDKVIDDEINKLREEIDLLKEKNDQKERDIELTRLKDALENAKKNKNKRVWNGSEWVWMADQSAIDDAQKALDDFLLQDKTDALQNQIDDLNDLKNQYADVTKIYDQEQQKQQLIAMLGANAEADILNQRIDTLNKFKDKYLDIQKQIANYDKATPESLVGGKSPSTSTGGGGTSGGSNNSGTSQAEIDAIARDVIRGKYGNGQARKNALGDKYSAVQARVNQMLSGRSYAGGGIVDYTGLAMLHGSPNKPEMVLNYDQIKTFMGMLSRPEVRSNITNTGQSIIYNFSGDFNLPNVNNAQQFLRDLKSQVNIKRHSI